MRYTALATDYDGTLAHDGVVDEPTLTALRRAKAAGIRLVMVTGRELEDLRRAFAGIDLFECIVAENGALLYWPATGEDQLLAPPPPADFVQRLRSAQIPLSLGRCIVATVEPHEQTVLRAIHDLHLEWQIIFNKGSVMALPSGVNKATGLRAALARLQLTADQVVAVGDAENDEAFLAMCGLSVAVANALPAVKARAKVLTNAPRGAGVSELLSQMLDGTLP